MKLSIIIVNFNTQDLLKQCLLSLQKHYHKQIDQKVFQVIVVDNASDDGSVKMVKQNFPFTNILQNKTNKGFSYANNQGIKKSKGEYILLLNPDTIIYAKTLTRLLKYIAANKKVGIATCKIILPNGKIDDASHRGFPTPWRALTHFTGLSRLFASSQIFNGYHLGYKNMDKIHEIDACAGAFLLIRKQVGEEVSWLDEDYYWYGEDLDLCYRVKQAGYKIMYVPDVSILHYKGAASGIKTHSKYLSKASQQTKQLAMTSRFAVMRIFYQKHYFDKYPRWLTNLVFAGIDMLERLFKSSI